MARNCIALYKGVSYEPECFYDVLLWDEEYPCPSKNERLAFSGNYFNYPKLVLGHSYKLTVSQHYILNAIEDIMEM